MSTDLMPNRYKPGEADIQQRESELIARRDSVLGSSYRLQYRRPVHFVRGDGMWLYDPDGRAYLDFYNNVPSLGHCHPEVNAAMVEQAGRISANTRYLEPRLVDYAERLVATFPTDLERVVFTCTGSKSNDLALRIARLTSGHEGVIVSSYAYHGTSAATAMVSPNLGDAVQLSPSVRMVSLPGPAGIPQSQAADFFEAQVRAAIADLNRRGTRVAALLIDSIFSSDGVWSILRDSSPPEWTRCGRQADLSLPTKFNQALDGQARICGVSSDTASPRTSSPSASPWAMASQLVLLSAADRQWIDLAPAPATRTRSPATPWE